MGTTSKMNIPYPENNDFVADGATNMKDIADQVDAKTGLILIETRSVSAVTASNVDNVFSFKYETYLLSIRYQTSADNQIAYQNRVGGVDAANNYNRQTLDVDSSSVAAGRITGETSTPVLLPSNSVWSYATIIISGPNLAQPTVFKTEMARTVGAYTVPAINLRYANHSTATAYDGFRLFVATGTFTAQFSLYGMNK